MIKNALFGMAQHEPKATFGGVVIFLEHFGQAELPPWARCNFPDWIQTSYNDLL